jgi:diaminopimelate epimerase
MTSTWAREIDFVKLSPTQNMTVLVRSRHPVREYRTIAAELLSAGHVHAEQVGFIRTPSRPRRTSACTWPATSSAATPAWRSPH